MLFRVILVAGLACLVLFAAGCGGDDDESSATGATGATGDGGAPAGEPIIIGDASASSGIMSSLDQPASFGVQIAIDDINAQGGLLGRPLEYRHVDSRSDPNQGARAATDLLDDGAKLIIVTCDFDFGAPSALEAERAGVISFSQCGASTKFGPLGIGPTSFTMSTSAPTQGNIAAEFAYNEQGWETAWTLLDNSIDFEKQACGGFEARYTELGGEIVGEDTMVQQDPQIGAQITRLKAISPEPDFLMICSYQPGVAQVIRQIRAAGINAPIYGFEDLDGTFWHETVPDINNVFFGGYGHLQGDDPNPDVNAFMEKFVERSGGPPPTTHAITGYSIIEAWTQAVEEAGTVDDTEAVITALESFSDEEFLVGPTSFSPEFHIQIDRSMRIMEIPAPNTIEFLMELKPEKVILPEQ